MRKYYEAYDDRYRQIHNMNLQWAESDPSPIVQEIIEKLGITRSDKLLELGCGEGRDTKPLLLVGYDMLATDISPEAISYCQKQLPQFADRFQILDCITGKLDMQFDFIYAVAVVHMLVEDCDRNAFYSFIRGHLRSGGKALICTMGDGEIQRCSDPATAFTLQERIHQQTGTKVKIAGTSCRMVTFADFENELRNNGLTIIEKGITETVPGFSQMMYAVVCL